MTDGFILLAPNSFKGTLDAPNICRILADELSPDHFQTVSLPMGDGGDGTAGIVASYLQASPVFCNTCDALGRPNKSFYYRSGKTAVIELAAVCGLKQLQTSEYDVYNASTKGFGMAIAHAVSAGVADILLCVGGSASIDAGLGALAEMGMKIVTSGHQYHNHILEITEINTHYLQEKLKNISFTILCDVDNPLCGPSGAASVFGPQKGATPLQIAHLDSRLAAYARLLLPTTGKDAATIKHGGAAGGIAASFSAILNAKLISGADYCIRLSDFDRLAGQARCVITGEGKIDRQSLCGKVPGEIARRCRQQKIKVIGVAGLAEGNPNAFDRIFTLAAYSPDLQASLGDPEYYLRLLCKDLRSYLKEL